LPVIAAEHGLGFGGRGRFGQSAKLAIDGVVVNRGFQIFGASLASLTDRSSVKL
jgi:hypothetical protein